MLLGFEPPLGPARGASVTRDVPSGGVKAEPKSLGHKEKAKDPSRPGEAGRAPSRRRKPNKQTSSSSSDGSSSTPAPGGGPTLVLRANPSGPVEPAGPPARASTPGPVEPDCPPPKFVAKRYKQDRSYRREQGAAARVRTPPPPPPIKRPPSESYS